MAETLTFELVSPEALVLSGDALEATVPGSEGEFGILPQHAPYISTLKPGILTVKMADGATHEIFVRGGFAEAGPDALTVLAEEATAVADIDPQDIAQAITNAEEDVRDATDESVRAKAQTRLGELKQVQQILAQR